MATDTQKLLAFFEKLSAFPRVVIQAHDFPDHDAVASAFALSCLLERHQIDSIIVYNGVIDRVSLQNMVDYLEINIHHWKDVDLSEQDIVITVDGCIGQKNLFDIPGAEIAVIDHHLVSPPEDLWFSDVRPEYGSTATIVYEYFMALGLEIPQRECTALQIGLAIDTANLTRGFIQADVEAFSYFHQQADQELVNRICRNSLLQAELDYYRQVLDVLQIEGNTAFAWLQDGCPKNMLGILGDFLLALEEVDIVVLAATAPKVIQLSLRSECKNNNVAEIVSTALQENQIGFGGGHAHMAGGIIQREKWDEDHQQRLFELFQPMITRPE